MEFNTVDEISTFIYEQVLESLKKVEGQENPRFVRMPLGETQMVVINFKLEDKT